jgi:hypothetical protein
LRAALARELISKITRAKQTESMAQVVEGLLCQREALTSNTSPMKETTREWMTMNKIHYSYVWKCHNETHYFVQLMYINKNGQK